MNGCRRTCLKPSTACSSCSRSPSSLASSASSYPDARSCASRPSLSFLARSTLATRPLLSAAAFLALGSLSLSSFWSESMRCLAS